MHATDSLPGYGLRISQLEQAFGEFHLKVEHLDIAPNTIVALMGPTGAGKSSLLKLLAGASKPSAGEIEIVTPNESAPHVESEHLVQATLVFQKPLLLSGTVERNIQYPLRFHRCSDSRERCDHWIHQLGLDRLRRRQSQHLSAGEAHLVALARALALRPNILLLDEPTASHDPATVARVEDVLRREQASRPLTIVWGTHQLHQARRIADSCCLMLNGSIIEHSSTQVFFEHAQDPRTSDFVQGKMVY